MGSPHKHFELKLIHLSTIFWLGVRVITPPKEDGSAPHGPPTKVKLYGNDVW